MQVAIEITPQQISDQFIAAVEGGSTYWLHKLELLGHDAKRTVARNLPWYSDPAIFSDKVSIEARFDDPKKDEGNGKGRKFVTEDEIAAGLASMAKKSPHAFAALIAEDGDALTADVFLQHVIFQEVVYG